MDMSTTTENNGASRKEDNLQAVHSRMVSAIWKIADDCLRDVFQRGQYRDVILPFLVLRRIDVLLEPTKDKVLQAVEPYKSSAGNLPTEFKPNDLYRITGYRFFNTSCWTLQQLKTQAGSSKVEMLSRFNTYINGFSPNVQEIIEHFGFSNNGVLQRLADNDRLLRVIEEFTRRDINFSVREAKAPDGTILPPLTNIGMGYVFEELLRRFNEENNEDAGEHFTPREIIRLMCRLVFEPVKDNLPPIISLYDPACGTGGMLTQSFEYLTNTLGVKISPQGYNIPIIYPHGAEVNPETYAICKSDMLIGEMGAGEDEEDNKPIKCANTLSEDCFPNLAFDFMLSNPPYGKSWAVEAKEILGEKDAVLDSRFEVLLEDFEGNEVPCKAPRARRTGNCFF